MFSAKKNEKRRSGILLLITCMLLMLVSFIVDTQTESGIHEGMFYLPLILFSLFIAAEWATPLLGIIASVFIVLSVLMNQDFLNISFEYLLSHAFSLLSVWVTVALIYFFKNSKRESNFFKEKLNNIVAHAEEGIIISEKGKDIIGINATMEILSGYHERELIGGKLGILFPSYTDEDLANEALILQQNNSGKSSSPILYKLRKKNGDYVKVNLSIWEFELDGRKFTICYLFDLTEKTAQADALNEANISLKSFSDKLVGINSELESRVNNRTEELNHSVEKLEWINQRLQQEIMNKEEAVTALRESQMMMETVAVNYPNGILSVLNRDYKLIYAQGREIEHLGLKREDLIGGLFLPMRNPEAALHIKEILDKAFAGEKISFEYQNPQTLDYYLFHGAPLPNTGNEINQILVVSQNITSLKNAEFDMRKALEKEHELNELKTRFVSTASHEFRTPLAAILSSATLISMYNADGDQEKRLRHVHRIATSVNNLTEMLNDFLSLGKIEEGKVVNHPLPFDIVALCDEILEDIKAQTKVEQTIKINYDINDTTVVLDKLLLRNVLLNLLSNAVKYSSEGSEIILNVNLTTDHLNLVVKDQGIGIPEADQKHLFETFFRAGNVENIKGTGMGLNIVKRYLDIMQGSISFESRVNEGSSFLVTLPLQAAVL